MRFTFEVHGRPVTEGSTRGYARIGKDGRAYANVVHDNPRLHAWRTAIGWAAKARKPPGWDTTGPMSVDAVFWLPRPKNHYLAWHREAGPVLRPDAPWWPTGPPDTDKLLRAVGDALTGIAWVDDSQIVAIRAEKRWHDGAGLLICTIQHATEKGPG